MENKTLHDLKALPYNLRAKRKIKDLTQSEFARILNIPANTYNGYETGQRTPDVYTLKKIANHLDTTMDDLLEHDPDCFIKSKLYLKEFLELLIKIDNYCYSLKSEKGEQVKCVQCAFSRYWGLTNNGCIIVQIQKEGLLDDIISTCDYRNIDYKRYIDQLTIYNNVEMEEDDE